MGDSVRPVGEVHILGQSRMWPAIAVPGAAAIVMIIVAVAGRVLFWYGAAAVAASVLIAVTRRRNMVLSDDTGLLIKTRRGLSRSYAWSEIDPTPRST